MYPGYKEYLEVLCLVLKQHTNGDDEKKASWMQVIKQNAAFLDPAEVVFML